MRRKEVMAICLGKTPKVEIMNLVARSSERGAMVGPGLAI
jgi:hypothetical protein